MNWNYAELSLAAKNAGGPELFTQSLINAGKSQMIIPMCSISLIALGAGIVIGYVGKKIVDNYNDKISKEMQQVVMEVIKKREEQNVSV